MVKRIQFSAFIEAPPERVYQRLIDIDSFRDWTSAFAEGSTFEGSCAEGNRIALHSNVA